MTRLTAANRQTHGLVVSFMIRMTVLTILTALAGLGATACSSPQAAVQQTNPVAMPPGTAPAAVAVPGGNTLVASLDGTGVQIYQCAKATWTLLEPAATLADHGRPVALHFKGPIWVSTTDGSEVGATAVPGAAVNHNGAVQELLLKASEHHGAGRFADMGLLHDEVTVFGHAA